MSLSGDRFMKDYTPDFLVAEVKGVVSDTLTGPYLDTDKLTAFVTVRDFKAIKDTYYGSKLILKELCGVYSARRLRMWVIHVNPNLKPEVVREIMDRTELIEWTAVRLLQDELVKKYGPVPDDVVAELDALASSWEQKAQDLQNKM